MRKLTILMSVLLTLGMFSACSSDDEMSAFMDEKLSLFEDSLQSSLQSIPECDYTGYLGYDNLYGWSIIPGIPYDYASEYYFPLNLPDELKSYKDIPGVKVAYSGKVIQLSDEEVESLDLFRYDGKEKFYFVYLTKIEIIEGGGEIPYRGNPPFTIKDMPGTMVDFNTGDWCISYVKNYTMVNLYYPIELSDDFKVQGLNVIISGNVYEEFTDPNSGGVQKKYKIELTKIEKAE